MQHNSNSDLHWPRVMFAGLALACAVMSGNANAQWIVNDPIQTGKNIEEFALQLDRWKETAAHYQQQLISLQGMNFNQTNMGETLSKVEDDYGMEDACRKKKEGGVLGSIGSLFKPDANADILSQQLEICRRIVRAENLKYNETVSFLMSLREQQKKLNEIDGRRGSVGKNQGQLAAVDNDLHRYQQSSKMDLDKWQAMIQAYDNYIGQLNKYQQRLAERALRGKQPDLLSTIVQGAVLREALKTKKTNGGLGDAKSEDCRKGPCLADPGR